MLISWHKGKTNQLYAERYNMKVRKILICSLVGAALLFGCGRNNQPKDTGAAENVKENVAEDENMTKATAGDETTEAVMYTGPVHKDEEFGHVYIGADSEVFLACGFEYGDSCNVVFENGFEVDDVPFFSGYFVKTNEPVLVDYQGYENVLLANNCGDSMWEVSGCADGDAVRVTLAEKGKYKEVQDTMAMTYSDDRSDYENDEAFANFRMMEGGRLASGRLYRGASPVDDSHNRAEYVDGLLSDNNLAFVLDLADTEQKLEKYRETDGFSSEYYMSLYENDKVALLGLSASYRSDAFAKSLAEGLNRMSENDGPYYIHCTEGKDRTGFACILLEAAAGCTYDEILDDYMYTYYNYFGVTKDDRSYDTINEMRFQDMMFYLTDAEDEEAARNADLEKCAENYLTNAGMTEAEFDRLLDAITTD